MEIIMESLMFFLQVLIFPGIFFLTFVALLWEWVDRKFYARLQNRVGPYFTGKKGFLQPLADFLKLLSKEDLTPEQSNKRGFNAAPIVIAITILFLSMFIPITGAKGIISFEGDLLFILFGSSLIMVVIMLSGWFSSSPFAIAGGTRTGLLMIAYELPMIITLLTPSVIVGSLNISTIITYQLNHGLPFIAIFPIMFGFLIYIIALEAELERVPFDVSHAETEIVAGWKVEYSGKKLALLSMVSDLELVFGAGIATAIFLGGPYLFEFLPFDWAQFIALQAANTPFGLLYYPLVFLFKSFLIILILSLFRALMARLRIDQIINASWKILLPLAILVLLLVHLPSVLTLWGL